MAPLVFQLTSELHKPARVAKAGGFSEGGRGRRIMSVKPAQKRKDIHCKHCSQERISVNRVIYVAFGEDRNCQGN